MTEKYCPFCGRNLAYDDSFDAYTCADDDCGYRDSNGPVNDKDANLVGKVEEPVMDVKDWKQLKREDRKDKNKDQMESEFQKMLDEEMGK